MSDSSSDNPPRGDFETAEKYINQLVDLLNDNKIEVYHTDLKRFDPTTLQDHYTINLKEYQIELSHSKQPESGKDSYVMIFNNMKQISEGSPAKAILAYIYLADSQFSKFKVVADHFIEQKRKMEEERRFKEALQPIDQLLDQASDESNPPAASISATPLIQNLEGEMGTALDSADKPQDHAVNVSQIHQI